jgi:hypothetical protein
MGDRTSDKRPFLPVLALAGFTLFQTTGLAQDIQGKGATAVPRTVVTRSGLDPDDPGIRRMTAQLRFFRSIGDLETAARLFAQLFPPEAAADPAAEFKKAAAPHASPAGGFAASVKPVAAREGAYPVFISPEHEKDPSAAVRLTADGGVTVFSAAEQWTGDRPGDIRIRKSTDSGLTWPETLLLRDGRALTRPSLREVADGAIGVAYVKNWNSGDGDICFTRFDDTMASPTEFAVALSLSDQTNPSLATDRQAYAAPFIYIAYAEHDGSTGSVKLRVSRDLGESWSRDVIIDAFPWAGETEAIETALTFDPDTGALHLAYTRPRGALAGVAVATSTNFGASWSRPVFLTPADVGLDSSPAIAARDGTVIVVYEHASGGSDRDIGLARSDDSGRSWTLAVGLAASAAAETCPDVRAVEAAATPKFFASYVEASSRVLVLSCDGSAPGAWTAEGAFPDDGPAALGSAIVVPMPGPRSRGSAGVLWADTRADADIYFSSAVANILTDLVVTPANQDVPYTAGETTFAVGRTDHGKVSWAAEVVIGQNWLSILSGESGDKPGTIVAAYLENPSLAPRVGSIRISRTDVIAPLITVTVTQAGAPEGSLSVSPAAGFASAGPAGGPFTPSSQDYALQNVGTTSIDWSAAKVEAWTALSAASGTLAPGATTTVTVAVNAEAETLTAGVYDDTVTFTNTTNGDGNTSRDVTLTVTAPPGVLSVTPAEGLTSAGPGGGPFLPSSQTYTLENTGGTSIDWTASRTQDWTTLSATAGTLDAGATATVTVSINTAAGSLAVGDHADTVSFANTTNGNGDSTRPVALTVTAGPVLIVLPNGRSVPFAAGTTTFEVSNTGGGAMTWTAAAVSGMEWLSISSGTSGTDGGTIVAAFTANPSSSPRAGTIRITASGAAGSPADVTVTQAGSAFSLTLSGQRLVERAWMIRREFGRLTVAVNNPGSIPVGTYVVYRRAGAANEELLQQIAGSTVTSSPWTTNDAFLEPGTSYAYRVVALDAGGSVLAESNEITI